MTDQPLRAFCERLPPASRRMVITAEHAVPRVVQGRLGEEVGILSEGLGMNLPPSFQKNQDRAFPVSDEDWNKLFAHMDWLGIKMLRYWLWGEAVFPEPGKLERGHIYLERLRRFDAWAQRRGVRLLLDLSGMPEWLRYPAPASQPSVPALYTAPRDARQYVDEFAMPLLRYILCDLKLKSILYLVLVNEPFNVDVGLDTFYTPPDVDPFQRYVELHAELRRRLNEEGLTLGLVGPDSHDRYIHSLEEFERRGLDLLSHVAIVDEHAYRMRLDYLTEAHHVPTMPMSELVESHKPSIRTARAAGKPYVLTEYSCFYYASPDGPMRHESAITEAEFVIRMLAEGVDGALRYSLINSGEADGNWQAIKTADGSYAPSPNIYYAYALLSRYAPRGGKLRRLEFAPHPHIHGVAIEYPDDLTVLVVNDHPGEAIAFELAESPPLIAWQTDAVHKHRLVPIEKSRVMLPPMSVTALTTFAIHPNDPGLI